MMENVLTEDEKRAVDLYMREEMDRRRTHERKVIKYLIGANILALLSLIGYAYYAVQTVAVQAAQDLVVQEASSFRAAATATFAQISEQQKAQSAAMATSFNDALISLGRLQERNENLQTRCTKLEHELESMLVSLANEKVRLDGERRRVDQIVKMIDEVQSLAGYLEINDVRIGMERLAVFWDMLAQADEASWIVAVEERLRILERGCIDECTFGERMCDGEGYRICGDFDQDECTEWSSINECSTGDVCVDGECVSADESAPEREEMRQ